MDKIREEFEKEYDVIEFRLDSDFPVFEAGYKARDEEIKRLRYLISPDAPDKYFNDLLDNISKQELQEEIKKLRDEMDRFLCTVKQHLYSPESNAALAIVKNAVKYYEEQALKESE